ncbi:MAG TPA: lysylphosphatidylglycerol synthase transmembrane domain-containing protein [Syntrophobacteraceae bacterium]|nr:lysylphosphatidylglycerol synthase transmembrane domain-containing protein [Syntrophobacteraceae bacterium]
MIKFHTVCVLLGLGLLVFLIRQIGFQELWSQMSLLGWGLVPLVLIEVVADALHTIGWKHCLPRTLRSLSFSRLFRIRLAGYAINYLTPTATLGGEITKGMLLSLNHTATGAFQGVVVGKLAYTIAQLLFVSLGSILTLWGVDLPRGVWPALLSGSALLAAGVLGFLVAQKFGKLGAVLRWLSGRKRLGKHLAAAAAKATEADEELRLFYRSHPLELPIAVLWHMAGMACGVLQAWYFLYLLSGHPSMHLAAGIWCLGGWFDLMTFAVPLGIGIQEATRVFALKAVGFDAAMGLAYGVTLRLEQILRSGLGLLCYATLLSEKNGLEVDAAPAKGPN